MLRATTPCTFSTSQLPKVVRTLVCFVHFDFEMCFAHLRATTACNFSSLIWPAGSTPAALASLLFDSPEPQIVGKTPSRLSYLFAHLHLLSSDSVSSTLLSSNLSLLSASALLCFSYVSIFVGSQRMPYALPGALISASGDLWRFFRSPGGIAVSAGL